MSQSTKSLFMALCLLGLKIICGEEVPTPCSAAPTFSDPNTLKRSFRAWPAFHSIRLRCKANGAPPLKYTWLKDGHRMPTRRIDPYLNSSLWYLKLKKLMPEDSGKYTCVVSNPCGSINRTYRLKVVEKVFSEPQIYFIWEQKFPLYVGESVVIFCNVLTKDPKTKYHWYYSNSLSSDENNLGGLIDLRRYKQPPYLIEYPVSLARVTFTLKLENLTIDQSGFYGCQAENSVGNGSRQTNVTVVYRPVIPVTTEEEHSTTSMSTSDTVSTHLDVSDQQGVKPQIAGSAWTSRIQYLGLLIAVAVVVFIGLILAFIWMYWQMKKARQTSARSRRSGIDSIQPKYEVKNEYVVVPDFK